MGLVAAGLAAGVEPSARRQPLGHIGPRIVADGLLPGLVELFTVEFAGVHVIPAQIEKVPAPLRLRSSALQPPLQCLFIKPSPCPTV